MQLKAQAYDISLKTVENNLREFIVKAEKQ